MCRVWGSGFGCLVHWLMESMSSFTDRWVPLWYVFGGEFGEPPLDEVQSTTKGVGVKRVREAGVALQPALYGFCFVGGGVDPV